MSRPKTQIPQPEARRAERVPLLSPVRLGWINDETRMEYAAAQPIDISHSGLAVAAPQRLRLSALVHVEVAGCDVTAIGRVRNCVPAAQGWRAGIEIIPLG